MRELPEDDRGAREKLLTVLLGPDDTLVADALEGQVLAVRGALGGPALVLSRSLLGQEDADAPLRVRRQRRVTLILLGGKERVYRGITA